MTLLIACQNHDLHICDLFFVTATKEIKNYIVFKHKKYIKDDLLSANQLTDNLNQNTLFFLEKKSDL